jgi:hypothetical protein
MTPFATCLLALALGLGTAPYLYAQPAALPVTAAVPDALTARQPDNVAALGQVWGLLKYHHPAVAAGQRDWDAEFRRQLPRVLACRSVAERSRLLSAWVASLGIVPPCANCAAPLTGEVRLAPNLRWAENKHRFSAELRWQLTYIQANRYQGTPYYVGQLGSSTQFLHKEAYADQPCPPADLRLLGLCRYWNTRRATAWPSLRPWPYGPRLTACCWAARPPGPMATPAKWCYPAA